MLTTFIKATKKVKIQNQIKKGKPTFSKKKKKKKISQRRLWITLQYCYFSCLHNHVNYNETLFTRFKIRISICLYYIYNVNLHYKYIKISKCCIFLEKFYNIIIILPLNMWMRIKLIKLLQSFCSHYFGVMLFSLRIFIVFLF